MNFAFIKFLWPIIRPYKWWYLLMMQAPIVGAFYNVTAMYSLKLIVDAFGHTAIPEYSDLLHPIALYVGSTLLLEVVWRVSQFAWMKSQPFVRGGIVAKSYDYVQHHSYSFFQNTHSGSIASKIKGIVTGYDNLWFAIHHRAAEPLLIVLVGICALAFINLQIFIFVAIWSCIFFPIMVKMSIKMGTFATHTNDAKHMAIGFVADNISNIYSIFSFTARLRELTRIKSFVLGPLAEKDYNEIKYDIKTAITGGVLYTAMVFSLFIYMIHLRKNGSVTTGGFVFVMTSVFCVIENIWRLVNEISDFSSKMGDLKSSFSILQIPHDTIDKPNPKTLHVTGGGVTFSDISFEYANNKQTFYNLNLHIKPGEKVGLVGRSGAGKSTLIALLLKHFRVTGGDITIDGQSIYDVSSDSLRLQIALIPQDVSLFHRSIGDNIGYAKENVSQEEIENAAKKAHIHEFIIGLQDGYNTLVGERGVKLSGGQRQRIGIARAILKDAPILILDEATSSLDSDTEKYVQESLNILIEDKSKTVIAIAHRLSTLKHMDRIIVLDTGKILEEGTHDELLNNNDSLYKKLWELQEI